MNKVTSDRVAQIAARGLRQPLELNPNEIKTVCASALAQHETPRGRYLIGLLLFALGIVFGITACLVTAP